jgi:hypothetical protein
MLMGTVTSVQEATHLVDTFQGAPTEFQLLIPDALNDSVGLNMALITDRVLARDWQPDGFTQKDGYRIYHYAPLD